MSYNKAQIAVMKNYTAGDMENEARLAWVQWLFDLMEGKIDPK